MTSKHQIDIAARNIARDLRSHGYVVSIKDCKTYLACKRDIETDISIGRDPYANRDPWAAAHHSYVYKYRPEAYCALVAAVCEYEMN